MEVAVRIPSFGRPESIRNSARSALVALGEAGTAGNVIIVDDGRVSPVKINLKELIAPQLVVSCNHRMKGASGARNHGADITQTPLLFFLDDDDLMESDYIVRVLAARAGAKGALGFSEVRRKASALGLPDKACLLGAGTPLSHRLAGLGTGFWIERSLLAEAGGLDETIGINEDTDLCLTLASGGWMPWYDPRPGVRLDAARSGHAADRPSTTHSTKAARRAAAWQRILHKHDSLLRAHPMERAQFSARLAKFLARSGALRKAVALSLDQPGMRRGPVLANALPGALTRRR